MKFNTFIWFSLSLLIFTTSCGVSYIVTDADNDIYVNGVKMGTEKVEITRTGVPKGANVDIKLNNKIVNSKRLKREFTLTTAALTLVYWSGLLFGWQYPKSTYIKGKVKKHDSEESIWAKPPEEKSIWQ